MDTVLEGLDSATLVAAAGGTGMAAVAVGAAAALLLLPLPTDEAEGRPLFLACLAVVVDDDAPPLEEALPVFGAAEEGGMSWAILTKLLFLNVCGKYRIQLRAVLSMKLLLISVCLEEGMIGEVSRRKRSKHSESSSFHS